MSLALESLSQILMFRAHHWRDSVQRVQPHREVLGILNVQNLEEVLDKILRVEKDNPLEEVNQHNFRLARAKD